MDSSKSTLDSLKSIITILAGLTITNSSMILLTDSSYSKILDINDLPIKGIFLYLIIIVNVIRFYHGNTKHIDIEMNDKDNNEQKIGGQKLAIDFFLILLQSIIFSIMSFYINNIRTFFGIFIVLLFIDIFWYIVTNSFTDKTRYDHQKKWTINNLLSFIVLLVAFLILESDSFLFFLVMYITILINTIVDFIISWKYYFPEIIILERNK